MPRSYQNSPTQDHGRDPDAGEWQALRGELVDLLDQVEGQYARANARDPEYEALAQRVRDLRHQVAEPQPQTRQREALRSVQRAVDRFSDRDEPLPVPANPRDSLQSAILEIRSRQHGLGASVRRSAPPGSSRSAEEEAMRFAKIAAQQAAEDAARRLAEIDARRNAEIEARRMADLDARRAAELEAQRVEDLETRRATDAAARRAEQMAQRAADAAAQRAAEQRAAEESARRTSEAAERAAAAAAQRVAEETARRTTEAAERAAEMAARRVAEEAERRNHESAQRATEASDRRNAEIALRAADLAAQRASEETGQRAAEIIEAQRRTAEEYRQQASAQFEQMAGAVNGIAGRLEQLETGLKSQGGANKSNMKDVAEQIGQLTHVVELLAGAVGETGQVKRLESQIADLSEAVANAPTLDISAISSRIETQIADAVSSATKVDMAAVTQRIETQIADLSEAVTNTTRLDMSAMTKRIEDLSKTVERLAEIQVQNFGREEREIPAQTAALRDGMDAIEESVRTVYDRIDAIEKTFAMSPADLERLTGAMATFTEAMKRNESQPNSLVPLIDALNARIAEIETKEDALGRLDTRIGEIEERDSALAALKSDIDALRHSVVGAVEPRFAAIETKIETLSERVSSATTPDINVGALEDQIRQLVSRMDQTGEQLAGLAAAYARAETAGERPDYDQIAALIARKTSEAVAKSTSEAMARTQVPVATAAPTLDVGAMDQLEKRMSALFLASGRDAAPEDMSEVQDGIRKVDERLERLELVLRGYKRDEALPVAAPIVPAAATPISRPAAMLAALDADRNADTSRTGAPAAPGRSDTMPASPIDDLPVTGTPFANRGMVQAALDVKTGRTAAEDPIAKALEDGAPQQKSPVMSAEPTRVEPAAMKIDPASVQRPPRPQSSLAAGPESFVPAAPPTPEPQVRIPSGEAPVAPVRASTFIEAARRATLRQNADRRNAEPTSLIGRALARFQHNASAPAAEAAPAPVPAARPAKAEKPAKPVKPSKQDANPAKTFEPEPVSALPGDADFVPRTNPAVAIDKKKPSDKKPGFLTRHRQPVLLAASVVAVSVLALNLVSQRMGPPTSATLDAGDQAASADTTAATQDLSSTTPPTETAAPDGGSIVPRVVGLLDNTKVGSINPAIASSFAAAQPMPEGLDSDAASVDASAVLDPALADPAIDGPVTVDMPPDTVGPEGLRKAAADGDARAQFEIAAIYTEGSVVPQDYAAAAMWYERSAAQGFVPAQYRLGSLYEGGKGVTKDLEQARLWYQRAADAGNRMSMHNLAALFASGELGKQDFESAAEWFEQAAMRGMTDSQFNLGMLYARGLGVPQSLENSYKWFSIAAMSGDADAATARDDMAKSLDTDAVRKVTDELMDWKPTSIDLAANFAPIGTWSADFDPGVLIDNKEVIKKVQAALNRLGYDVGVPDGVAGPKTAEAIKQFEHGTGMTEVGAINPRLLAVLGSQPV